MADGAATIGGGGAGYSFAELASTGAGSGDFSLRARVALRGMDARSTIAIGWRGEHTLAFLMPVQTTPPAWHALIDNAQVNLQHEVAAGSAYAELELDRSANSVTFAVDGQVVDQREYAGDLSASVVRVSDGGSGAVVLDSIELR